MATSPSSRNAAPLLLDGVEITSDTLTAETAWLSSAPTCATSRSSPTSIAFSAPQHVSAARRKGDFLLDQTPAFDPAEPEPHQRWGTRTRLRVRPIAARGLRRLKRSRHSPDRPSPSATSPRPAQHGPVPPTYPHIHLRRSRLQLAYLLRPPRTSLLARPDLPGIQPR